MLQLTKVNFDVPAGACDCLGGARPEAGVEQPGFADMTELARSGKAYVKISILVDNPARLYGFA